MKYFQILIATLLIVAFTSCHKGTSANAKFVGTWHDKGGTNTSTFYSNGGLNIQGANVYTSYAVISYDTMQFNSTLLPYATHRTYYEFISDTELYIQAYIENAIQTGYYSDTLVKN